MSDLDDLIAATERERRLFWIIEAAEDLILTYRQMLYSSSRDVRMRAQKRAECPPYLPSVYRTVCRDATLAREEVSFA